MPSWPCLKPLPITLLAPKVRRKKGEHREIFEAAKRGGFVRLRVNGEIMLVEDTDTLTLDKQKWHYIDIVVDRLIIRSDTEPNRVTESVGRPCAKAKAC